MDARERRAIKEAYDEVMREVFYKQLGIWFLAVVLLVLAWIPGAFLNAVSFRL